LLADGNKIEFREYNLQYIHIKVVVSDVCAHNWFQNFSVLGGELYCLVPEEKFIIGQL